MVPGPQEPRLGQVPDPGDLWLCPQRQRTSLKKKQTVYLETTSDGTVHIKTHLNRYVYGTAAGQFLGDAESPSAATAITIEPQVDGTWALKTAAGFYIHGAGDNMSAFTKEIPADGKWVVHLAMHPQCNIMNVMRKRYIHLDEGELHCNEDVPWGADALVTLHFFDTHPEGRYGIIASNGQFLTASGRLTKDAGEDAMFLIGFHDDQISLRDKAGNYLSCVGAKGMVKVNKSKVGKDELFVVQDSEPQFIITSSAGKKVSVRTGTEVKADQTTVTDLERFQLELHANGQVSFKTSKSNYWGVGADGTVNAEGKDKASAAKFTVQWKNDRIALVGPNGKAVTVKSNGGMKADGADSDPTAQFILEIINRPQLILRGQYGFVGLKGASGRVEVCRSTPTVFELESEGGKYYIKGPNGKYWGVDGDGLHCNSSGKTTFYLEFVQRSKCLLKTEDGAYLEGEQNGGFKPTGKSAGINTLWEF